MPSPTIDVTRTSPSIRLGELLRDVEAEADPFGLPSLHVLSLVEPLEDAVELIRRDPAPVVRHAEARRRRRVIGSARRTMRGAWPART